MHAESNALRQSFAPQSMLRSSWSQLVIAGLDPAIHLQTSHQACNPEIPRFPGQAGEWQEREETTTIIRDCPGHLPWRHPLVYPTSDVIPGFNPGIFRLSLPKPEMAVFFFVILGQAQRVPGISGYSGQARIWQEREKKSPNATKQLSESDISGKFAPENKKTLRFVSFWVRDSAKFVQPSAARIHFVAKKS